MSEENGKVCCNCRHNIRKGEIGSIKCYCDIDNHYISYIDTFEHWCTHWAKEKRNDMESVYENKLRDRRIELYPNMSATAFSKMVGLSQGQLSRYENGYIYSPDPRSKDIIPMYASALDIDVGTLLTMISTNYELRGKGLLKVSTCGGDIKACAGVRNVLSEWRLSHDLSCEEAASIIGVSKYTYYKWECGNFNPTVEHLDALITATGLSKEELFSISNNNDMQKSVTKPNTESNVKEAVVITNNNDTEFVNKVMKTVYGSLTCDEFIKLQELLMKAIN